MNDLNLIHYKQFKPHSILQYYIQCYWSVQRHDNTTPPPGFYLHPDGASGLVFNLGSPWLLNGLKYDGQSIFSAPNLRSTHLQMCGDIQAIGIRFLPGMASLFMSDSLADMPDHSTSTLSLFGQLPLDEISDQMSQLENTSCRINLLELYLMNQLKAIKNESRQLSLIRQSIQQLNNMQGQFSIAKLARETAIGQRQLERNFKHYVGITAKQYNRLIRVKHCRNLIKANSDSQLYNLADIAQQAGYHDQPHFIREFKSVLGISPGSFLKKIRSNLPQ